MVRSHLAGFRGHIDSTSAQPGHPRAFGIIQHQPPNLPLSRLFARYRMAGTKVTSAPPGTSTDRDAKRIQPVSLNSGQDGVSPCCSKGGCDMFCLTSGDRGAKLRLNIEHEETVVEVEFDFDVSDSGTREGKQKGKTLSGRVQEASWEDSEVMTGTLDDESSRGHTLYTEFGMIGRGTTVIPVVAAPGTEAEELFGTEALVAKVAWLHAVRKPEDEMIKVVRRRLAERKPNYLKHIVDLKCSMTKSAEDMHLPRCALGVDPGAENLRACRILILKKYEPLETIGSAENFHVVFLDVVRAHHWVYETSMILHRDISPNNIMWYRLDGRIVGVLCDWDLAEDQSAGKYRPIRRAGDVTAVIWPIVQEAEAAKPTTTTLPSVPEGQATEPPPPQEGDKPSGVTTEPQAEVKPRYLTYDPATQVFTYIQEWQRDSLVAIGDSKRKFLTQPQRRDDVIKRAHADLQPLLSPRGFLRRLLLQFARLEYKMIEIDMLVYGGLMGESNDPEIEGQKKEREEMISYSKFMEILGAPEDV
ncbi:hypothetical protein EVJ58_g11070 [Rhodofomes roseus]|uniref:Fungal-type protein kinase domain-containing protein n=1 Tax=Rhodofomes roseus TaxID=34475 RepID=A0A4Y9XL16_9APHY|nr:hypothetical protein EVJ58_g11070 [Rhodofomes roseus]